MASGVTQYLVDLFIQRTWSAHVVIVNRVHGSCADSAFFQPSITVPVRFSHQHIVGSQTDDIRRRQGEFAMLFTHAVIVNGGM